LRVTGGLVCLLALSLSLRGTVALAWDRARDPWEPMLTRPTAETMDHFEPLLEHLSLTRAGDPRAVDILYERDLRLPMAWYLREYPNARETVRVAGESGATVLISGPREPGDEPQGYIGQPIALRESRPVDGRPAAESAQWLLFRKRGRAVEREVLWVWVRTESEERYGE